VPEGIIIRMASPDEMKSFYGGIRIQEVRDLLGAFIGERCIGMAGVMRDPSYFGTIFEEDGSMIGFLDIKDHNHASGAKIIRAIRSYLKSHKETIHVQCDEVNFQNAGRLLKILGFIELNETETDVRNKKRLKVWRWQHSEP
jgi:hypothetical protein